MQTKKVEKKSTFFSLRQKHKHLAGNTGLQLSNPKIPISRSLKLKEFNRPINISQIQSISSNKDGNFGSAMQTKPQ
ncbi:hypothetical protein Hanom_Chr05g00454361 [Helianthus anomalus]